MTEFAQLFYFRFVMNSYTRKALKSSAIIVIAIKFGFFVLWWNNSMAAMLPIIPPMKPAAWRVLSLILHLPFFDFCLSTKNKIKENRFIIIR